MKTLLNLNLIIRPVNDLCNLNCTYCDTKERYARDTISRKSIKHETFQKLISDIRCSNLKHVRFTWHGGEPLLLPDNFYQEVFTAQKELGDIECTNTIQTNGLLINEERLLFFKKNNVAVGFSLDGSSYAHNSYRFDTPAQFETVLEHIQLAKKLGIMFSIIIVAHDRNVLDVKEICEFIRRISPPNGFIISPLFIGTGELASLSIKPDMFSEFLMSIYDEWKTTPMVACNYVYAVTKGMDNDIPKLCFFSRRCANFVSMNGSGDMFSTCHENSNYFLGNINKDGLEEILERHILQHETKIEPQFKNQSIYREMHQDPALVYFQGKGCTRRLLNGRDPYFRSYIDLINHSRNTDA